MKKTAILVATMLAFVNPASAATVGECLATLNGLQALDHYDTVEAGKPVAKQYKLAGSVRFTLAMNLAELQKVMDATQKARQGILNEISDGVMPAAGSPKYQPYIDAFQAVLDRPCEVKLATIKVQDLNLDQNEVPFGVLAQIRPILDPIDRIADAKK